MRAALTATTFERVASANVGCPRRRGRARLAALGTLWLLAALAGCGRSTLQIDSNSSSSATSRDESAAVAAAPRGRPAPRNLDAGAGASGSFSAGASPIAPPVVAGSGAVDASTPGQPIFPDVPPSAGTGQSPPAVPQLPAADAGAPVEPMPCPGGVAQGPITLQTPEEVARLQGCQVVLGDLFVLTGSLANLRGLEALTHVEGNLTIAPLVDGTPAPDMPVTAAIPFDSLAGLENLQHVTALELTALGVVDLAPLSGLQEAHYIILTDLDQLTSLAGLEHMQWSSLSLVDNDALTSLSGLTVRAVAEDVLVSNSPLLADLGPLRALTDATSVTLMRLPSLSTLDVLSGLRNVTQLLAVIDCDALADLMGLGAPLSVLALMLDGNETLRALNGLSLAAPPSATRVANNPQLASLAGLMAPGDNFGQLLDLEGLPALTSLTGLETLRTVDDLRIQRCDGLSSFSGLNGLQATTFLYVSECAGLQTLTGLEAVTTIGSGTYIQDNPLLASLRGLASLTSSPVLEITRNPSLPQCEVDWLHARVNVPARVGENGPPGMCAP